MNKQDIENILYIGKVLTERFAIYPHNATLLIYLEQKIRRLSERECNGCFGIEDIYYKRMKVLEKEVNKILNECNENSGKHVKAEISGDPRGSCLRLYLADDEKLQRDSCNYPSIYSIRGL